MQDLKAAGSKDQPTDPSTFYEQAIARSRQAEENNDARSALNWLRQAEFIGTSVLKNTQLPEVNAGYVRLIVSTCRDARNLAIHSGNITDKHFQMALTLRSMCAHLKTRFSGGDAALAARASVLEGLSEQVYRQVSTFKRSKQLYSPAPLLDSLLDNLLAIMVNAGQLGVEVKQPFGCGDKMLELTRTAASNAQYSINRIGFLSDYDKARFYCQRGLELLGQHLSAEGSDSELDEVHALLKSADQALGRRDFKQSSAALRSAHEKITFYIANQ